MNFLQKMFTDRNLKAENFAVTVSGDSAWSVYDWTFTAKMPKVDGRWVIAHLHYSSPVQPLAQPPQ